MKNSMKCPRCDADMRRAPLKISDMDVWGWKCPKCSKVIIELEDAESAIQGKRGDIIVRGDLQYLIR